MGVRKYILVVYLFILFCQIAYAATLSPYLIDPIVDINVSQNEFFNFTTGIKCVGGDCGNVTATLDPKAEFCGKNPCCRTAESPCIAGSDLLMSADNATPIPEPHAPNTIDNCTEWMDDPSIHARTIENITITDLDEDQFRGGDTVRVDVWMYCIDRYRKTSIAYTNSTNRNPFVLVRNITCPIMAAFSFELLSTNISLDNIGGNHTIRALALPRARATVCATNSYDEQDDLTILVLGDKGVIPMHSGAPFYTINQNPVYPNNLSCLQDMRDGDECNITWTVNATGGVGGEYEFFVIFESDNPNVEKNETEKVDVRIIEEQQEEPQENLTRFNISLIKGWNLISSPLNFTNITRIFEPIKPYFGKMFAYDASNQKFVEIDPYDNAEVDLGYGVWLNTSQNITLGIVGEEFNNKNVYLFEGWNLMGYPSLNESLVNETLKDVNYSIVYWYNNSNWISYARGRNDSLNTLKYFVPGYGYWVKVG